MARFLLISGAALCMLAVVLGAFAAHGLKSQLSEYALGVFQTGVTYQFYHGLALILFGILQTQGYQLKLSGWLALIGCVFFSGSLYLLALTGVKWFGPITPIGGTLFIASWLSFIWQVAKTKHVKVD